MRIQTTALSRKLKKKRMKKYSHISTAYRRYQGPPLRLTTCWAITQTTRSKLGMVDIRLIFPRPQMIRICDTISSTKTS